MYNRLTGMGTTYAIGHALNCMKVSVVVECSLRVLDSTWETFIAMSLKKGTVLKI